MKNRNLWLAGTALALYVMVPMGSSFALPTVNPTDNPTGGVYTSGHGTITGAGTNNEVITQDTNTKGIITWDTFNIGANATTQFIQGAQGVTLNRIGDVNPSQIFGSLKADGTIMLVNKNGIMFGAGSTVDVGSLVATTHDIKDATFNSSNGSYKFDGVGSAAGNIGVVNNGNITVNQGGIAALVAPSVVNNGVITAKASLVNGGPGIAKGGKVSLAGGEIFTVDLAGDGLVNLAVPGVSGKVTQGSTGKIIADAGVIQLTAKSAANLLDSEVNIDGIVQAATVNTVGGKIILDAANATVSQQASANANAATVSLPNTNIDINAGIGLAGQNGTVNLAQGTYTKGNEIFLNKTGVKLNGTGSAKTTVNVSNPGGFGVLMTADNTQLNNLTVNGTGGTQNPIKITSNVTAAGNQTPPYVNGVQLNNVNVTTDGKGAVKSMIDVNGATNLAVNNVTITGHGSYAGLAITDSNNTTVKNLTTSGDGYGIALQTSGGFAPGGINGFTLSGNNNIGEDLALLTSVNKNYTITNVNAPAITYTTQDAAISDAGYGFYSTNKQSALNLAFNQLPGNSDVVVQGLDTTKSLTGNDTFYVGQNGTVQMGVQAAIDAATAGGLINVQDGTYSSGELFVNKGVTINGDGTANTKLAVTNPNGFGVLMTADNSALQNLTVNGVGGTQNPIKITNNVNTNTPNPVLVDGVKLTNVAVTTDGTGNVHSMIDVNGANDLTLNNVNIKGHGSYAGLSITDSNNTTADNLTTSGDGYGIALQTSGKNAPGGIDGFTLGGTNSIGEDVALLTNVTNNYGITKVSAPDLEFETTSAGLTAAGYAFYSTNQQSGLNVALGQAAGDQSTVLQYLDTSAQYLTGKNEFLVGNNGTTAMSIQAAADAVDPNASRNGVIDLQTGTYDTSKYANGYLFLTTNGLTINGAGIGNTFLNATNDNTYGVRIQADNVTLNNFNVNGPAKQPAATSQEYGIKAEVGANTGATLDNLTLNNVFVQGAGKTQIDLNTTTGASFNNVTVVGNGVRGAGLFLTDSDNVTLYGLHTSNNAWGGVADSALNENVSGLKLTGNNTFGESNPLYTETANGHTISDLELGNTFSDLVHDNSIGDTFYQTSQANAVTYSQGLSGANTYIEGLASDPVTMQTAGNNLFYVPTNLQIQTAIDAANGDGTGVVNVAAGTFTLTNALNLNKSISVQGAGDGITNINGAAVNGYPIVITADNTKLGGFYLYEAGNNAGGVSVNGATNVALSSFDVDGNTDGNKVNIANASNVTLDGVRAHGNGHAGAGIAVADSSNVMLNNVSTDGNGSGGLVITANSKNSVNNVVAGNSNSFAEANPIETIDNSNKGNGFGTLTLGGYTGTDPALQGQGAADQTYAAELADGTHTYYQTTVANAENYAANVAKPGKTYLEGLTADANGSVGTNNGNNTFYVPVALKIQTAIDAARSDIMGTVNVLAGLFTQKDTLTIDKPVDVIGAGSGQTIIDTHKVNGDGIELSVANANLHNVSVQTGSNNTHAIEIDTTGADAANPSNNNLGSIAITGGASQAEVAVNGGYNDSIFGVNIDGNNTKGAGIAVTDSNHLEVAYNTTSNDNAGGLIVTSDNGVSDLYVHDNTFNESNPVETIDNGGGFTNARLSGGFTDELADGTRTYYQTSLDNAEAYAANVAKPNQTYLEELSDDGQGHLTGDNTFYVPTNLSIQTAIDAAKKNGIINLFKGLYDQAFNVNKALTVNGQGDTGFGAKNNTVIAGNGTDQAPVTISHNNVALNNLSVDATGATNGVVVAPAEAGGTIHTIALNDVTVRNANQSNVLVNDAHNVTLQNVSARNSVNGQGVEIDDSSKVALNNVQTRGNAGGGVLVQAIDRNTNNIQVDQNSRFREDPHLFTKQSLDANGVKVTNVNPGIYVYTANNPQYDQSVGAKTVFYYATQRGAQNKQDQLDTDFPAAVANNGLTLDDSAITRETTRRASGGPGTAVASLGTGNVFDLLQPAAGGDSGNTDVSQQPLDPDALATGQNFLQSGQVTSGPVALQKLLSQAGATANGATTKSNK